MNFQDAAYYRCLRCDTKHLGVFPQEQTENEVLEGHLVCADCSEHYPIRKGIPRFVTEENYAASFGFQWQQHIRTQLDSYTGLSLSRTRLFEVSGWPENLAGQSILEAGSGAGRFTEILLATGAEVFSFDYSTAVEANWQNNNGSSRLHLFQANLYAIPLQLGSFDKVLCLGVLQHTPNPERAFHSLARHVRPGGELVVDIYRKSTASRLHWKYLLRPITNRMNPKTLYRRVRRTVPVLLPAARWLRRVAGRTGARLVPVVEYSHLGLSSEINKEWAILDTFDMYSPRFDRPQSRRSLEQWFQTAGFTDIHVASGPNGLAGRGYRPA